MSNGSKDVEGLFLQLAERLWALQRGGEGAPHLILPRKRNFLIRVSEQESKILLCSLLEETPWHYSIETPTHQAYVQKGMSPQSARIDVSLYDTPDPSSLSVNIELKSHNPGVESFRKDFEKLLREGIDGAWFHTLLGSNRTTIASVFAKVRQAFEIEQAHLGGDVRQMTFAFIGLDTQNLAVVTFEVGGDQAEALALVRAVFDPEALDSAESVWSVYTRTPTGETLRAGSFLSSGHRGPVGSGLRSGQLVVCPTVDPATFMHLSLRGDSYFFRRYTAGRIDTFKAYDAKSLTLLLETHPFEHVEPLSAADSGHDPGRDVEYWSARVRELNAQRGLAGSGPVE